MTLKKYRININFKLSDKNVFLWVIMWNIDLKELLEFNESLERIAAKKKQLSQKRPLPAVALQKIKEGLSVEWTYNSNSIEGNTLTLRETRIVLEEGMTVKGKSMREHFEITNHHDAIEFVENLVSQHNPLRERDILDIHQLVMLKIEKEFSGRFRNAGVRIVGANFLPPNARKVPDLMAELVNFINQNPLGLHEVILAAVFHHRFVWIHPFFDGNGRTVRLVMNLILMQHGYPPAIILKNDRKKYYDALNQANNGSYKKLLLLVIQALERSLDIYISSFQDTDDEYLPISSIVMEADMPYGQEYVSLLARSGKIDAYKEGRNWLTTQKAVREYVVKKKKK
jgi:Fic family protein